MKDEFEPNSGFNSDNFERSDDWSVNCRNWFAEASASIASIRALSTQGRSFEEWKEDVTTAEWADNFFLHEMKIAPADFFNDRFVIVRMFTPGGVNE